MNEITILNRQTLSNKKYILEHVEFRNENAGDAYVQQREVYYRPDTVSILLYDAERRKVVLTRQFRLPVWLARPHTAPLVEACAGRMNDGELPEHTVIREVEEETGYRISEIELIGSGFNAPASSTQYVYFYLGKYSPDMKISDGGGLSEEGEHIQVLEMSYDEIKEEFKAGRIQDVKTLILVQHAMLKGVL